MSIRVNSSRSKSLEELENNFNISSAKAPLPPYDALRDGNLRQYFESRTVQKFLQSTGWVDKSGKIVDLDKFRAKLNIIEQEFKYAEKTEFWRMKEEEEMRRTIQMKRERALQDAKRCERATKIKEENRIRRGIILAVRNHGGSQDGNSKQGLDLSRATQTQEAALNLSNSSPAWEGPSGPRREPPRVETEGGGFFVTQHPGD